jgi:hypothetical protein
MLAQQYMPKLNLRNVLIGLVALFVVRNLLFRDYKSEEIKELQATGLSAKEIERFVPTTAAERRKYVDSSANDVTRMKKDIAFLLQEVHELKENRGGLRGGAVAPEGGAGAASAGDDALKTMDSMHAEKRRKREQESALLDPNAGNTSGGRTTGRMR